MDGLRPRKVNTSGIYLRLHPGDPALIRSPAFNRVTEIREFNGVFN